MTVNDDALLKKYTVRKRSIEKEKNYDLFYESLPRIILQKYPIKSLMRCFSKFDLNNIKIMDANDIALIYEKWRLKEATKRRELRYIKSINNDNTQIILNNRTKDMNYSKDSKKKINVKNNYLDKYHSLNINNLVDYTNNEYCDDIIILNNNITDNITDNISNDISNNNNIFNNDNILDNEQFMYNNNINNYINKEFILNNNFLENKNSSNNKIMDNIMDEIMNDNILDQEFFLNYKTINELMDDTFFLDKNINVHNRALYELFDMNMKEQSSKEF
jgi:hypothetical protein